MTATIRKQIQRAHLKHNGGKRLDLYLTRHEADALADYAEARKLRNLTDAVRQMIAETHGRLGAC